MKQSRLMSLMNFEAQWWPEKEPIPKGWHVADDLKGTIHNPECKREGRNFILIVREEVLEKPYTSAYIECRGTKPRQRWRKG